MRVLLLLLAGALLLFFRHVTGMLPTEQAALRWAYGEARYGQVTAFFPVHNGLSQMQAQGIFSGIQGSLAQEGFQIEQGGQGGDFVYAYSAQGVLEVASRDRGATFAYATFVGGNFFHFQPVQLISGSHLPQDDVNRDMVLIDENLAWRLFGSVHLIADIGDLPEGEVQDFVPEVFIEGMPYVVVGVFRPPGDFASRAAYGDGMHIILYYDAPGLLEPPPITSLQAVLPNPVGGFAEGIFAEAIEGGEITEDCFVLVNNAERYRLRDLFRVMGDFGSRSMYRTGLSLPYWENAARLTEDYAALALLLMLLLFLLLFIQGLVSGIRRFRRRKWRLFATLSRKVGDRAEERKERAHYGARYADTHGDDEDDARYDVEDIIRFVRESEGQDETED